jgi:hypothetical protein
MNFVSYKLCKLFFNVFPNVLCVNKPLPAIYTILIWSLQKCKRGVILHFLQTLK